MNALERKQKKLENAKRRTMIKFEKKEAKRLKRRATYGRIIGLFKSIVNFCLKILDKLGIRAKIQSSIVAQLLLTFVTALLVGITVTIVSMNMAIEERQIVSTSYEAGYNEIYDSSNQLFNDISQAESIEDFFEIIENVNFFEGLMSSPEIYITDDTGNVLVKNGNATAQKLDILNIAEKAGIPLHDQYDAPSEIFRIYKLKDELGRGRLLIFNASPREDIIYSTEIVSSGGLLPYINGLITFVLTFMLLMRKKMKLMTEISDALLMIADGDLNVVVDESGSDEVALLAENINIMCKSLKNEKEEQERLERTKSELITNVSHDLRTPLTSIMGYLGLIRSGQYKNDEEMLEYAQIAYQKSEKLKALIDDLFEYTKYSNMDTKLEKSVVSITQLIQQILSEYVPVIEESELTYKLDLPDNEVFADIDARRVVRASENLLMNAIKYSKRPSTLLIKLESEENQHFKLTFRNLCPALDEREMDNLFERLYKADKSRSQDGSGLGLAITKGIIEAHGGSVFAQKIGDDVEIGFEI